jgi:2-haloacid dehalogenase
MPWVLFDLNGTVVDPVALIEPRELALEALVEANMCAMITALGGREAAFKDLLGAALRRRLERAGRDPALAAEALERLPFMPPFPEAAEALVRLRAGGFGVAVLTQSSAGAAETVLANAGLAFDRVLSAPASGVFKPDPRAYRYGLEQVGADDAWFVAAHWWDVAGAAGAGLRTAWVSRDDVAYPDAMPQPDVRAADLIAAADAIVRDGPGRSR